MRLLYPEIKANNSFHMAATDGHEIYVEESGNPDGIPVVYIHGGPGAGSDPVYRRFYNPEKYRIILFDQRGCGKSTPHSATDINALWGNTTMDLVNDIEQIRKTLNIEKWLVTGGSWGTTLALLYSIEYPSAVLGLILRGIFLARQQDVDWLFADKQGASQVYPEHYADFIKGHDFSNSQELLESYHELLTGDNDLVQLMAAKQFCNWEGRIASVKPAAKNGDITNKEAIAIALLNSHYFTNNSFIYEHEIISEIDRIQDIPGYIIHGRFDMVCKAEGAMELARNWRNGQLEIVPNSGHSCLEPGVTDALIKASDEMATFLEAKK